MGRAKVIEQLKAGTLPVWIGSPHPSAIVVAQDGRFRIRELVVDREEAERAANAAQRTRSPSWMPEHYYALGQPTGKIYVEASSLAELVDKIAAMDWPENW
jgi:hypothetical protein